MSINRKMRSVVLQKNDPIETASGAKQDNWVDVKEITIAISKTDETLTVANEKYKEASHTGLTYERDIEAGTFRLVFNDCVYRIISCNAESRLTNLLLKEVAGNGR